MFLDHFDNCVFLGFEEIQDGGSDMVAGGKSGGNFPSYIINVITTSLIKDNRSNQMIQ